MRLDAIFASIIVLAVATAAMGDTPVPPPTSWSLQQNDPNPFCPGVTQIEFAAPQAAEVELVVLSMDGTTIVRELVHGALAAGLFTVAWDGKDTNGVVVVDGDYPYRLKAFDAGANVLFQGSKIATVSCQVDAQPPTWSTMKRLFD